MRNSIAKTLLFFIIVMHALSCRKEKDEKGPDITFISPADNQSYMVYDHVAVKADIKDATKIVKVSVTLVDGNYIPMQESSDVPVTSPSMTANLSYQINNIHIESGLYYIMISASDGKNDSHQYRPVYITAVPRVLKKLIIAAKTSNSQTDMYEIDSVLSSKNLYHTFSGDYLGTSASSYFQQTFMCGNYSGSYTSMSLKDNSVKFTIAPFISASPCFTAYYSEEKNNYVARYDETVRGYNNEGGISYNAQANSGYYVTKIGMNNGVMLAEEVSKSGGPRLLVSFFSTGVAQQQKIISQNISAFCEKDGHDVFVFGNIGGQGVIQLYDRTTNNLWNPYPYSLPTGSILSAVKINEDTYLIGLSDGTIYKYQYASSSITPFLPGYTALEIKYDAPANEIYIAEQNKVSSVNLFSGALVHTINCPENIVGMDLLYNR